MAKKRKDINKKRLTVGITGASGAVLGVRLLEELRKSTVLESHLVISSSGLRTLHHETGLTEVDLADLAGAVYSLEDIGADIAGGTFITEGMVVIPCSMKTLAGIRHGFSDNLLLRAADVTIKERKKLVLVTREMPLSPIHLENMLGLANMGAVIMPPMVTFYNHPRNIEDMCTHIVGKVLSEFGQEVPGYRRWGSDT